MGFLRDQVIPVLAGVPGLELHQLLGKEGLRDARLAVQAGDDDGHEEEVEEEKAIHQLQEATHGFGLVWSRLSVGEPDRELSETEGLPRMDNGIGFGG